MTSFEIEFEKAARAVQSHLQAVNDLLANQPAVSDLDATDSWLRDLNALAARHATVQAQAEAMYAVAAHKIISDIRLENEFKKIKGSSTLVDRFTASQAPTLSRLAAECRSLYRVILSAMDNTRTLASSYRLERQIDANSKVKQTQT